MRRVGPVRSGRTRVSSPPRPRAASMRRADGSRSSVAVRVGGADPRFDTRAPRPGGPRSDGLDVARGRRGKPRLARPPDRRRAPQASASSTRKRSSRAPRLEAGGFRPPFPGVLGQAATAEPAPGAGFDGCGIDGRVARVPEGVRRGGVPAARPDVQPFPARLATGAGDRRATALFDDGAAHGFKPSNIFPSASESASESASGQRLRAFETVVAPDPDLRHVAVRGLRAAGPAHPPSPRARRSKSTLRSRSWGRSDRPPSPPPRAARPRTGP